MCLDLQRRRRTSGADDAEAIEDFGGDSVRTRTGNAAANFALIRHVALNLLRAINDKVSIRRRCGCRRCGSYQDYLEGAPTRAAETSATLR